MDTIEEEIIKHIKSTGVSAGDLSPKDMLFENGILDSFSMVELIGFIESRYKITLGADDLTKENLESVSKIALLVRKRK